MNARLQEALGTRVEGWMRRGCGRGQAAGVRGGEIADGSFGSGRDLRERWPNPLTLQM